MGGSCSVLATQDPDLEEREQMETPVYEKYDHMLHGSSRKRRWGSLHGLFSRCWFLVIWGRKWHQNPIFRIRIVNVCTKFTCWVRKNVNGLLVFCVTPCENNLLRRRKKLEPPLTFLWWAHQVVFSVSDGNDNNKNTALFSHSRHVSSDSWNRCFGSG